MAPRLTREDIAAAADVLRRLVAALEAGQLDGPRVVTDHLRGAAISLEQSVSYRS